MKSANVYLNFAGNAEEAFNYDRQVLGADLVGGVLRFRDFPDAGGDLSSEDQEKVAHSALSFGDSMIMASDVLELFGQPVRSGNNYYISLDCDSADAARRIFGGLAAGGSVEMPLDRTAWAEAYGICTDKFGVQWMVGYTGDVKFG